MVDGRKYWRGDMRKSDTDLSVLIQYFEIHNKAERKSEKTVGWYNEVLGLFHMWLRYDNQETSLSAIDEMVVRQFILYLQKRQAPRAKWLLLTRLPIGSGRSRHFFTWVHDKGYTDGNILEKVREPRIDELIVEPLTNEEVEAIFASINASTAIDARNAAIISMALDSGLRLSEMANL